MKRSLKNIIMIVLCVLLGVSSYFTMNYASKNTVSSNGINQGSMKSGGFNGPGGTPPDMNNSSTDGSKESDSNSSNSFDSSSKSNSGTPPERPSDMDGNGTPPKKGDGSNSFGFGGGPSMSGKTNSSSKNIDAIYYVLFGVQSFIISVIVIYLFMSSFNKKSFKETFSDKDKLLICVLASIILAGVITYGEGYLAQNVLNSGSTERTIVSSENVSASGAKVVDGKEETLTDSYEATKSDESIILVQNGGSAIIKEATLNKSSGDSSNTENSEFNGINAGVLVQKGSKASISKATIKTNAKGSNAVFATGEGAEIEISDSVITTTGSSSSRGLDATYGGSIKADNVTIKTSGSSSASLATDRGEGTVTVNSSDLETNGSGSPIIYSTGNISASNTKGVANGSQMVVIEGKNSASVINSTFSASGKGNRGEVDNAGVMIYQSMSGDASEGTGTFTAKKSTLSISSSSDYYKSAPMFFITNTDAVINLEDTKLEYGSGVLVSIKGTSEWGKSGSNGGNLVLNATNQDLDGDIVLDNISTMTLNLTKSTYSGGINTDNSAKEVSLKLDSNSKITLTGDSYVTSLEDADSSYSNINFNGYKLYVNGKAIN